MSTAASIALFCCINGAGVLVLGVAVYRGLVTHRAPPSIRVGRSRRQTPTDRSAAAPTDRTDAATQAAPSSSRIPQCVATLYIFLFLLCIGSVIGAAARFAIGSHTELLLFATNGPPDGVAYTYADAVRPMRFNPADFDGQLTVRDCQVYVGNFTTLVRGGDGVMTWTTLPSNMKSGGYRKTAVNGQPYGITAWRRPCLALLAFLPKATTDAMREKKKPSLRVRLYRSTLHVLNVRDAGDIVIESAMPDDANVVVVRNSSVNVSLPAGIVFVENAASSEWPSPLVRVQLAFGPLIVVQRAPESTANGTTSISDQRLTSDDLPSRPPLTCSNLMQAGIAPTTATIGGFQNVSTDGLATSSAASSTASANIVIVYAASSVYHLVRGATSPLVGTDFSLIPATLAPAVIAALNDTDSWIAAYSNRNFMQAVRVAMLGADVMFINTNVPFFMKLNPVALSVMSLGALRPTYRRLRSPLSHYGCANASLLLGMVPSAGAPDYAERTFGLPAQQTASGDESTELQLQENITDVVERSGFRSSSTYIGTTDGFHQLEDLGEGRVGRTVVATDWVPVALTMEAAAFLLFLVTAALAWFRNPLMALIYMVDWRKRSQAASCSMPPTEPSGPSDDPDDERAAVDSRYAVGLFPFLSVLAYRFVRFVYRTSFPGDGHAAGQFLGDCVRVATCHPSGPPSPPPVSLIDLRVAFERYAACKLLSSDGWPEVLRRLKTSHLFRKDAMVDEERCGGLIAIGVAEASAEQRQLHRCLEGTVLYRRFVVTGKDSDVVHLSTVVRAAAEWLDDTVSTLPPTEATVAAELQRDYNVKVTLCRSHCGHVQGITLVPASSIDASLAAWHRETEHAFRFFAVPFGLMQQRWFLSSAAAVATPTVSALSLNGPARRTVATVFWLFAQAFVHVVLCAAPSVAIGLLVSFWLNERSNFGQETFARFDDVQSILSDMLNPVDYKGHFNAYPLLQFVPFGVAMLDALISLVLASICAAKSSWGSTRRTGTRAEWFPRLLVLLLGLTSWVFIPLVLVLFFYGFLVLIWWIVGAAVEPQVMASYFVAVLTVLFAVHQQFTAMVAARDQFLEQVEAVVLRFIKQRLDLVTSNAQRVGLSWVPAPLKAAAAGGRFSSGSALLMSSLSNGNFDDASLRQRYGLTSNGVALIKAALSGNTSDISVVATTFLEECFPAVSAELFSDVRLLLTPAPAALLPALDATPDANVAWLTRALPLVFGATLQGAPASLESLCAAVGLPAIIGDLATCALAAGLACDGHRPRDAFNEAAVFTSLRRCVLCLDVVVRTSRRLTAPSSGTSSTSSATVDAPAIDAAINGMAVTAGSAFLGAMTESPREAASKALRLASRFRWHELGWHVALWEKLDNDGGRLVKGLPFISQAWKRLAMEPEVGTHFGRLVRWAGEDALEGGATSLDESNSSVSFLPALLQFDKPLENWIALPDGIPVQPPGGVNLAAPEPHPLLVFLRVLAAQRKRLDDPSRRHLVPSLTDLENSSCWLQQFTFPLRAHAASLVIVKTMPRRGTADGDCMWLLNRALHGALAAAFGTNGYRRGDAASLRSWLPPPVHFTIVAVGDDEREWPAPVLAIATRPERLFPGPSDSAMVARVLRAECDPLDTRWVTLQTQAAVWVEELLLDRVSPGGGQSQALIERLRHTLAQTADVTCAALRADPLVGAAVMCVAAGTTFAAWPNELLCLLCCLASNDDDALMLMSLLRRSANQPSQLRTVFDGLVLPSACRDLWTMAERGWLWKAPPPNPGPNTAHLHGDTSTLPPIPVEALSPITRIMIRAQVGPRFRPPLLELLFVLHAACPDATSLLLADRSETEPTGVADDRWKAIVGLRAFVSASSDLNGEWVGEGQHAPSVAAADGTPPSEELCRLCCAILCEDDATAVGLIAGRRWFVASSPSTAGGGSFFLLLVMVPLRCRLGCWLVDCVAVLAANATVCQQA